MLLYESSERIVQVSLNRKKIGISPTEIITHASDLFENVGSPEDIAYTFRIEMARFETSITAMIKHCSESCMISSYEIKWKGSQRRFCASKMFHLRASDLLDVYEKWNIETK